MIPLLHVLTTQPQLLSDHAEAYAELLGAEISSACQAWTRRAVLTVIALCSLVVAAVLCGVALMLWAVLLASHVPLQAHGLALTILVATPFLPLALAVGCMGALWQMRRQNGFFDPFKSQIKADLSMLRETGVL
jgi:hypothetical protein